MEPVVISVLYHPDFEQGPTVARAIHDYYYRSSDDLILHSTIGIPVYYAPNFQIPLAIEFGKERNDLHFLVILIDDTMVADELWCYQIKEIIRNENKQNYISIPVLFTEYGFDIVCNKQSINLHYLSSDFEGMKSNLFIALSDLITRSIRNAGSECGVAHRSLQVFISHAKKDGLDIAEKIRGYLELRSPLRSFFDAYNIEIGEDFKQQLVAQVKDSLFLAIITDQYSTRPWCLKEIIAAKRNHIPMLAIDAISLHGDRVFPYIGNTPIIRWYEDDATLQLMIEKILYEYLRHTYQTRYLDGIVGDSPSDKSVITLPKAPELLDLPQYENQTILYPEPPLGCDELLLLNEFKPTVSIFSSSQYISHSESTTELGAKTIGLSISDYIDTKKNGIGKEHFNETFVDIIKHLIIAHYEIAYGGDWRKSGFTEKLATIIKTYRNELDTSDEPSEAHFVNYLAWPIYLSMNTRHKAMHHGVVRIVETPVPSGFSLDQKKPIDRSTRKNQLIWAASLSKMRNEMTDSIDARIALGGKPSNCNGGLPGILEEVYLSLIKVQPVYLVGGYGGCAYEIAQTLMGKKKVADFAYSLLDGLFLQEYNFHSGDNGYPPVSIAKFASALEGRGFDCLNNGLSNDENIELATTRSSYRIVNLILKGLTRVFQNA